MSPAALSAVSALPSAAAPALPDNGIYREVVEQADLAISITDPHANIVYANQAFSRVTGHARDAVLGRNESILSNQTTPRELYQGMWQQLAGGQPWSGRLINRREDGTQYLAELSITPVLDPTGKVCNYLGMHRDITGLYQLECQVRNQKQLIESVVDTAPVAIALIDAQGQVVLDNQEAKKLFRDIGTPSPIDTLMDSALPGWAQMLAASPAACTFSARDVRIDRPGRSQPRHFSCSALVVQVRNESADHFFASQQQTHLLLVAAETTALRLEQERAHTAALKALLAEEERVASIRESLSAALFRLEEPLNIMRSAVNLLERRDPNTAAVLKMALKNGSEHIESLRQCIPQHGPEALISVNLNEVLRDVLEISTPRFLQTGVVVDWRPATTLPNVIGRPLQLRILFKALVENAVDAMTVKGWKLRELRLISSAAEDYVEVRVEDSGPGIAPDMRLKAFEPFVSTKNSTRHLGTGLSRAQQIVANHGGMIDLEPRRGGGCSVRVELPVNGDPI